MKTKGLGIDLKKKSVQLAWRGPMGWELLAYNITDRARILKALRYARKCGVGLAIIEKPFIHPKAAKSVAIELGRVCGRMEDLCEDAGLPCHAVLAEVWQTAMLTENGVTPRGRKDRKAASIRSAELMGAEVVNDDQADAVNMAEYGTLNARFLLEDVG